MCSLLFASLAHPVPTSDPNLTVFNHPVPKNGLVSIPSPLLLAATRC